MSDKFSEPEFVFRGEAIARLLNDTTKATFHKLERGQIPGAMKIGGRWAVHVPTLRAHFASPAAPAASPAPPRQPQTDLKPTPRRRGPARFVG